MTGAAIDNSSELVEINEQLPATQAQPDSSLSPIVQAVMRGDMNTETMREMLSIQKEYEENEAKKAFHKAVSAFKAEAPTVNKDKTNSQYNSSYTSLENMVLTVNPVLSKFGLDASWEIDQSDGIRVACVLTHELGHSKSTSMTAPADKSGSKNPIQEIKSTITYLKLATYESIVGIASKDGSLNDDGNGSVKPSAEKITQDQANEIDAKIRENDINMDRFMDWLKRSAKVDSIDRINKRSFKTVMRQIDSIIKGKSNASD